MEHLEYLEAHRGAVEGRIRQWPELMGKEDAINQIQKVIATCEGLLTELGVERNKLVQNTEGDKNEG